MGSLFALQGPGSCGKSSSIIRLFDDLQKKYPSATVQHLSSGTVDISVIMKNVKGGLTVGIESRGDPSSRLNASLQAFAKAKCDIIFCACRTRGMTVGWVNSLSSSYHVQFVPQTIVSANFAVTNARTAASLMKFAGL